MQNWPQAPILPLPAVDFNIGLDKNALRLEMESGYRQRRLFTRNRLVVGVSWSFTQAEFDIFTAFLKYKLSEGTDEFIMFMDFGAGWTDNVVRFVGGKYQQGFDTYGFWRVSAQLELTPELGRCTPNLVGFLTNPLSSVDLSAYFGFPVVSPLSARAWRLHTDDCGFQILYYEGVVNPDGSLNPGTNVIVDPGHYGTGWNSADLSFWSGYEYPEGIYLQIKCGNLWSNRPCIAGGAGS